MSYDTRKALPGQEYVQEVEMILDACKFSQAPYSTDNLVYSDTVATISAAAINANVVLGSPSSTTWTTTWGSVGTKYALTSWGEILSFTVTSVTQIVITARGLFGTIAKTIPRYTQFRIMHKGEADGSCRGFPYTCSNVDSYSATSKISLIYSSGNNAGGIRRFPGLRKVTHDSGEVDPGETIGARAQLRVDIKNQVHNDYGIVPYPDKRTSSGTMFGKLQARHPYFQGREIIFREGYRDANTYQSPESIERRFIIDSVNLSNGVFTISALDPLILTEDKKAQMPVASPAQLSAAITGSPASITYINATPYYFGAMSSTVYVRIDSEIIKCTVSGAATLAIVTRGYRSSTKDHDAGASIQDCIVFTGTHGIDAILFALQNYTKIPAQYIGTYSSVIALLPTFVLHETIISKPMAVSEFINYMVQLGNLIFGYDEETQKIAIEYTPELLIQPITIDQKVDVRRDSVTVDNNIKNQWTRLAYLFAPVDVTKDSEENFAIRFLSANVALESVEYIGQVNEKKTIKNGLLDKSTGDSLLATSYVGRVLQNNLTLPKIINLTLDASKVGTLPGARLARGSVVNLSLTQNEDKDGNAISELYQVLKLTGDGYEGFKTKLRRYQAVLPASVNYTISVSAVNYVLSDFYAPASPGTYVIYINANVVLGSYNTSVASFSTGVQAAGVTLKIINRGKILGMGGAGGNCGYGGLSPLPPTNGLPGGTAFNALCDCIIDNGSGIIWAGGGGGGAEYSAQHAVDGWGGAHGGGGGQGYGESLGGFYSLGRVTTPGNPPVITEGHEASGNQTSTGSGILGGEWGEQGVSLSYGSIGGLAGEAIKSNGKSVTFTSGDNPLNVRGRRT